MARAILAWVGAGALAVVLAGLAYAQIAGQASTLAPPAAEPAKSARPVSEPPEVAGMLAAQNQVRTRLALGPLTLSEPLIKAARKTAEAAASGVCSLSSSERAVSGTGASLYWASPVRRMGGEDSVQNLVASYVVQRWREGEAAYNPATAKCRNNAPDCAAYANLINARHRQLGCAKIICPTKGQVWVCHYAD